MGDPDASSTPAVSQTDTNSGDDTDQECFNPVWSETTVDVSHFTGYGSSLLPCIATIHDDKTILDEESDSDEDAAKATTRRAALGPLLLYDVTKGMRVDARCLESPKDNAIEVKEVGPHLLLPLNYPGWFHILDDAMDALLPFSTLREALKNTAGFASSEQGNKDDITLEHHRITPVNLLVCAQLNAFIIDRKTKQFETAIIQAGEVVNVSRVRILPDWVKSDGKSYQRTTCFGKIRLYLGFGQITKTITECARCTDEKGRRLLVPLDQVSKLYEVGLAPPLLADKVYQLNNILKYKAPPLQVKIVSGKCPDLSPHTFSGEFQINCKFYQEHILACTIMGEINSLLEIPVNSSIQFKTAENSTELFERNLLNRAVEYCIDNIESHELQMKIVHHIYDDDDSKSEIQGGVKLRAKGSFLLKERALPPLPVKRRSRSSKQRSSTYGDVNSVIAESEMEPHYERIPFRRHSIPKGSDASDQIQDNASELDALTTKCDPTKKDDSGYLMPADAQVIVEALEDCDNAAAQVTNLPDDPNSIKPCASGCTGRSTDDKGTQEIREEHNATNNVIVHSSDAEIMEAFLKDTLQHLGDNSSRLDETNYAHETSSELQTHTYEDIYLPQSRPPPPPILTEDFFSLRPLDTYFNQKLLSDSGVSYSTYFAPHRRSLYDDLSPEVKGQLTANCSWVPPEDLSTLTTEEVSLSLKFIGIKAPIVGIFLRERIDGKQLVELDELLLTEGFPELNALQRKKILDFKDGWRPKRWFPSIPSQGEEEA